VKQKSAHEIAFSALGSKNHNGVIAVTKVTFKV